MIFINRIFHARRISGKDDDPTEKNRRRKTDKERLKYSVEPGLEAFFEQESKKPLTKVGDAFRRIEAIVIR